MTASHNRPDRAVVDIGSNTVRLVVYAGPPRVPRAWLNESVSARLGRDLVTSGRMPEKAMNQALGALARYATIVADLGISDVLTVATAAVRDAENGPDFLAMVEERGLKPRLLSGEEEAQASAYGVIGAFPGARGVVADLGGGSLELIQVENEACHHGESLALGTLRLPALRAQGAKKLSDAVTDGLRRTHWTAGPLENLYLVGGTWRAFAAFAIASASLPLRDPHGFSMTADEATRVAKKLCVISPAELEEFQDISPTRAAGLPDAAALMRALLEELKPDRIIVSGWGLREGLLFRRLSSKVREQDPLLVAAADFAEPRGGPTPHANTIADWGALEPVTPEQRPLRLVSAQLALAAWHLEPSLRERHAFEWAMDKRWVGISPSERAWLATALLASTGKAAPPPELERLADWNALQNALCWGLTIRLARRLAAGSDATLRKSSLKLADGRLVLQIDPGRAHVATPKVLSDFKNLARWFGAEPELLTA